MTATVTSLSAPVHYPAEDAARDMLDWLGALADERHHTASGRRRFLASLRSTYEATAANTRLSDHTRRTARLILDGLPDDGA